MKVTVATEQVSTCAGCHISFVDLHEKLLDVIKAIEIVYCPILVDFKEHPQADIGLIEGCVRTEHDRHVVKEMREKCKTIVAWGTCACWGGICGANTVFKPQEIFDKVYLNNPSTITKIVPDSPMIPKFENEALPIDEVIKVDYYLPGCPPHPYFIFEGLSALIQGKLPDTNLHSVCGKCNRRMDKTDITELKRNIEGIPDPDVCLLSQGYICLGSVSLDRCLAPCPNQGMVCIGCTGPTPRIIMNPYRDIRTEVAERMAKLTKIKEATIIKEIENFARTYYSYYMGAPVLRNKPTFLIKKWMREAEKEVAGV